jgi:hypothetical protein
LNLRKRSIGTISPFAFQRGLNRNKLNANVNISLFNAIANFKYHLRRLAKSPNIISEVRKKSPNKFLGLSPRILKLRNISNYNPNKMAKRQLGTWLIFSLLLSLMVSPAHSDDDPSPVLILGPANLPSEPTNTSELLDPPVIAADPTPAPDTQNGTVEQEQGASVPAPMP